MSSPDIKLLLEKANQMINDPDVIIDLFDLSFVWVGAKLVKLLGYPKSEILEKPFHDFVRVNKIDIRNMVYYMFRKKGQNRFTMKTKLKKNVEVNANVKVFEFKGGFYQVGKITKIGNK
jgi:hypothetical protein